MYNIYLYANKDISDTEAIINWFLECKNNNITPRCIFSKSKYIMESFNNDDENYLSLKLYNTDRDLKEDEIIKSTHIAVCRKSNVFKKPYRIVQFYTEI